MTDDLRAIQRWLLTVIMHPEGVAAGITSDEARAAIDVSGDQVDRVITASQAMTGIERVSVYSNAYYARLLECLRSEYPALHGALGDDAFGELALGYLNKCPSRSYTLAQLGSGFAQFLCDTRPDHGEARPNWVDFLIDLATLERDYAEVFDGPGPEGNRLLAVDDLLAMAPEQWPDARLPTVPWLRLREFHYPVHEYATAVRRQARDVAFPQAKSTWLAITRCDYVVRRIPLSKPQYRLLMALSAEQTIAESLREASREPPYDHTQLPPADVYRWFEDWSSAGFFARAECQRST